MIATALSVWRGFLIGALILYVTTGVVLVWHLRSFLNRGKVPQVVLASPWLCIAIWPLPAWGQVLEWFHRRGQDRFVSSAGGGDVKTEFFRSWDDAVAYARDAAIRTGHPCHVFDTARFQVADGKWFGPIKAVMYKVTPTEVQRMH